MLVLKADYYCSCNHKLRVQAAFGHLDGFRSLLEQQACKCDTGGCVRSAVEGALESCDSDSEWIDATTSMHLLVLDGKLWIRSGRDKSQLCGLADLHPGGTNDLYVLYMWQDQYYEVQGGHPSSYVCEKMLCKLHFWPPSPSDSYICVKYVYYSWNLRLRP